MSGEKTYNNVMLLGLKQDLPFALAAFVIWGGWAFYANVHAGNWIAMVAAVAQGAFSLLMTFVMGYLTSYLYACFTRPVFKLLLPAFFILLLACCFLSILHYSVGTPAILKTISPALLVGFLFCGFKTMQLHREDHS